MRKGFEGLYGLVRERLLCEPLSGHFFLFCNAPRNRLKILFGDGTGSEDRRGASGACARAGACAARGEKGWQASGPAVLACGTAADRAGDPVHAGTMLVRGLRQANP